jgi:lysophospholipase L1-like esterase
MTKNYLALGDSYTVGESLADRGAFPYQMVDKLNESGQIYSDPDIIATTGWTTDELIKAIEEKKLKERYDLVTLLIGVNNQYRGYSKENYRQEFRQLLQTALSFADNRVQHVIVISIPDWGVTPFALKSGRDIPKISKEIDRFNQVNKEEALKLGVKYADITGASRNACSDPELLAEDGLHPSAKMYAQWAERLLALIMR